MGSGCCSLFMWKDPATSGAVFASVLVTLLAMCYYSLISVTAYTALFVLATVAGIKLYVYAMTNFAKKNVDDPLKKLFDCNCSVTEEQVQQFASKTTARINAGFSELRRLFLVESVVDSLKFGLSLWLLTYVGSWFNAMTLVVLAWVGLFTVPKIYTNNQKTLDPILEKIKAQLEDINAKVKGVLPAPKAAEVKKEN